MKTKFALFVIFNVCIYGISFSQNNGGGENPDSLSITFIDTTQNLQVNGSIVVDSSLTVKDSVIMEDNLHVYEKLTLEKDALLRENVYVGNSLSVDGESYSNGDAYFNQRVILNNLDAIDSLAFEPTNDETAQPNPLKIIFINAEGVLEKGNGNDLQKIVYFGKACNEVLDANGVPYMVVTPPDPTWENGPNKLFLAECPNLAKVGIGTSNPRVKLDVIGRTSVTHLAIGADPEVQTALFHLKATNLAVADESTLFIAENNQRKLIQLNNQGLLQVREVKVDLESWPDYVFEKSYKLTPLIEVEKFIKLNGHLPNVPSAKTIESEGVNLGEMNKILIEKVEELTLYLLEQNKKLQQQEMRILEMENQLKLK